MKQKIILIIFTLSSIFCNSQTFLNGSFENTTSPNSCSYNNSNSTFNSLMNNTFAFGDYQLLDIVISNCFIPSVPDGIYSVSIANNPSNNVEGEAIALELSTPMITGNSYLLSFEAISLTSFGPQGNLLIGSSITNNNFGMEIYNATTIDGQWTSFSFTFVAPNNGTHITVMPVRNVSSWNSIDNFIIGSPLSIENSNQKNVIKVFPNPSSNFIRIQGLKMKDYYKIYNVLGSEIKKGRISNNEEINISNLDSGVYFLKFERGRSIKIIKD